MQEKKLRRQKKIERAYGELGDLRAGIAGIGPIKRGTLSTRMMKCGKKSCRCHRDPEYRHGPYHWWTTKVKGRSKAVMVPAEMLDAYRSFIGNYRQLRGIIKKMEDASDVILEEKARLLKAPKKRQKK
jgi:hypothetical protein